MKINYFYILLKALPFTGYSLNNEVIIGILAPFFHTLLLRAIYLYGIGGFFILHTHGCFKWLTRQAVYLTTRPNSISPNTPNHAMRSISQHGHKCNGVATRLNNKGGAVSPVNEYRKVLRLKLMVVPCSFDYMTVN